MPGPANEETRRRTGLENPKGPDKNLQLAAEAQFINHTKWATESELLGASHRFLRQFSENPFAGTKMREHDCQPVGDVPPADARRAPATEMRASAADEVKAEDEGVEQAAGSEPIAAFASILQKSGFDSETPVASSSASPVKVVTTQTAAFKLNPHAKEFVPDPNLIMTPYGLLPREKPAPPHQREAYEPYDQTMGDGYRSYGRMVEEQYSRQDGTASSPWG